MATCFVKRRRRKKTCATVFIIFSQQKRFLLAIMSGNLARWICLPIPNIGRRGRWQKRCRAKLPLGGAYGRRATRGQLSSWPVRSNRDCIKSWITTMPFVTQSSGTIFLSYLTINNQNFLNKFKSCHCNALREKRGQLKLLTYQK